MTYDDLAARIAKLTPEQRAQEVNFLEPYDSAALLGVSEVAVSDGSVETEDDPIPEGIVYLC